MEGHSAGYGFRNVMSLFPTGVTIVAARDATGNPIGLTVNSFASVSLDPPLVLVCIGHTSSSHDALLAANGFTVSILSSDQSEVALRFAREPSEGRFEEVEWHPAVSDNPLVSGATAWLDCTLVEVLPGGDHSILIGRVDSFDVGENSPLVFANGAFGSLGSLPTA